MCCYSSSSRLHSALDEPHFRQSNNFKQRVHTKGFG